MLLEYRQKKGPTECTVSTRTRIRRRRKSTVVRQRKMSLRCKGHGVSLESDVRKTRRSLYSVRGQGSQEDNIFGIMSRRTHQRNLREKPLNNLRRVGIGTFLSPHRLVSDFGEGGFFKN